MKKTVSSHPVTLSKKEDNCQSKADALGGSACRSRGGIGRDPFA